MSLAEGDEVKGDAKFPRREDGTFLYVRSCTSWGRTSHTLVAASTLTEAKREHGWTRNRYESIRLHRATQSEVAEFADYHHPPLRALRPEST